MTVPNAETGVGQSSFKKNLLLLGVSSFLSLALVGTFFAFDFYRANAKLVIRDAASSGLHTLDTMQGWRPTPGATCRHVREGDYDVVYTFDENGYRQSHQAAEAMIDITFYGDSYTFGHGVNDAETFANVLAAEYLADTVQVYNAGVDGYGIVQMYQALLTRCEDIEPGDIVVFTPTSADIQRNLDDFVFPYTCAFRRGEGQEPVAFYPAYADGAVISTRLERTLKNKLKLLALTAPSTRGVWQSILGRNKRDTARDALAMMQEAKRITEARGGRFVLIFLPRVSECAKGRYQVDVARFDYQDIRSHFPNEKEALARLRYAGDSHWNPEGHRLAAKAIFEVLQQAACISEKYIRH